MVVTARFPRLIRDKARTGQDRPLNAFARFPRVNAALRPFRLGISNLSRFYMPFNISPVFPSRACVSLPCFHGKRIIPLLHPPFCLLKSLKICLEFLFFFFSFFWITLQSRIFLKSIILRIVKKEIFIYHRF